MGVRVRKYHGLRSERCVTLQGKSLPVPPRPQEKEKVKVAKCHCRTSRDRLKRAAFVWQAQFSLTRGKGARKEGTRGGM